MWKQGGRPPATTPTRFPKREKPSRGESVQLRIEARSFYAATSPLEAVKRVLPQAAPTDGADQAAAFVDVRTGAAYSILWLCRDVDASDQLLLPAGTLDFMLLDYRASASLTA